MNDQAVSPVIAVILMVAITVVLAATVFVLVTDIGSKSTKGTAVNMGLSGDSQNHRVTVTSAATNADWNRIELRTDASIRWALNTGATSSSTALAAGSTTKLAASPTAVQAGDFVSVCGNGAAIPNLTLTLRDIDANAVIGQVQLASVPAC